MEKRELISILKQPAINVMKEKKIIASILIAESICTLYSKDIYSDMNKLLKYNNPFANLSDKIYSVVEGTKSVSYDSRDKYMKYSSLEFGISNYITRNNDRFRKLINLFRYEDVLIKDDTLSTAKRNQLKNIIEAYQLHKLDIEALSLIYESKKNVIEIPSKNNNTLYYQKQSNCEPNKVKITPESVLIDEYEKKKKENNKKIKKGQQIILSNANLYENYDSKIPIRSISGIYYINTDSHKIKNNRCGIVMKKEFVGNELLVLGYIDINKIKR